MRYEWQTVSSPGQDERLSQRPSSDEEGVMRAECGRLQVSVSTRHRKHAAGETIKQDNASYSKIHRFNYSRIQ